MPRLILARHGRTDFNAAGRFQGWLDTQLDELGREQAKALANYLQNELKGAKVQIFSSPLQRAKDTAAAFAKEQNIQIIEQLKEINHGEWNNLLASQVDQKALAIWRSAPHTVLAGPGGESLEQVQNRALNALKNAAKSLQNDEIGLFFSHDAVIRCLVLAAINAPLSSFNALQLHNCSVCVIDYHPQVDGTANCAANGVSGASGAANGTSGASGANGASGAANDFTLVHFNLSSHTNQRLLDNFFQAAL